MLNRLTLFVIFGTITLGLGRMRRSSAPPKEADEPEGRSTQSRAAEGPYYDLTKEAITSHADWSSRNVMVMGTKLGDKTVDVAVKNLRRRSWAKPKSSPRNT